MFGLLAILSAAASQCGTRVLQCPHHGAQNLIKTYFSLFITRSWNDFPTIVLTAASLGSGIQADFKNCWTSPALTLSTNEASVSAVISSLSKMYFSAPDPKKRIAGTLLMLIPKYSASLSKSPWPSFLSDKVRRTPSGLVASRALNAYLAASDSLLSLVKRKSAAFLFWNIFQTAVLSKGKIALLTYKTKINDKIRVLVMCCQLDLNDIKSTRCKNYTISDINQPKHQIQQKFQYYYRYLNQIISVNQLTTLLYFRNCICTLYLYFNVRNRLCYVNWYCRDFVVNVRIEFCLFDGTFC